MYGKYMKILDTLSRDSLSVLDNHEYFKSTLQIFTVISVCKGNVIRMENEIDTGILFIKNIIHGWPLHIT